MLRPAIDFLPAAGPYLSWFLPNSAHLAKVLPEKPSAISFPLTAALVFAAKEAAWKALPKNAQQAKFHPRQFVLQKADGTSVHLLHQATETVVIAQVWNTSFAAIAVVQASGLYLWVGPEKVHRPLPHCLNKSHEYGLQMRLHKPNEILPVPFFTLDCGALDFGLNPTP